MASFSNYLKRIWQRISRAFKSVSKVSIPPDFNYPSPDPRLMEFLQEAYRSHGANAERMGDWICVDGGRIFTRGAHFNHRHHPTAMVIQADFITLTAQGDSIVESFAGFGATLKEAVDDCITSFLDSSFHALFVTLLGKDCDHVDHDVWTIGGQSRQITLGWLRTRGTFPHDQWAQIYSGIQSQLESYPLPAGLHWMRYFYCHAPSNEPIIETLVDNEPDQDLQAASALLPWPSAEAFYSARLFFIIQDANDSTPPAS